MKHTSAVSWMCEVSHDLNISVLELRVDWNALVTQKVLLCVLQVLLEVLLEFLSHWFSFFFWPMSFSNQAIGLIYSNISKCKIICDKIFASQGSYLKPLIPTQRAGSQEETLTRRKNTYFYDTLTATFSSGLTNKAKRDAWEFVAAAVKGMEQ